MLVVREVGVEVGVGVGAGVLVTPKYMPLTTALEPVTRVTLSLTWPLRSQTRYLPVAKEETVWLSNTALVAASTTSSVCNLCWSSQSKQYTATRCSAPSVRF